MSTLICNNNRRREKVRQHQKLNGLDFLEVGSIAEGSNQSTLTVHFLGKAPVDLSTENILIEGGQRIRGIKAKSVDVVTHDNADFDNTMVVVVDKAGDFSKYTLRVVQKNEQGQPEKHAQFDPRYDRVDFSFKVDCPNELDCKQELICPEEKQDEPDINYLAKDYASFRQLILDRLALTMPDWQERHVPDIGIALVEALAYTGDHLSYYQDAVATEAYLDTARKRISVRRHARLVDYKMHEGCNARAWICMTTSQNILLDLADEKIQFITGFDEGIHAHSTILRDDELQKIPTTDYEVFEPLSKTPIQLYQTHNRIHFYTWGDQECCLPQGCTSATLVGEWVPPAEDGSMHCEPEVAADNSDNTDSDYEEGSNSAKVVNAVSTSATNTTKLYLRVGYVLILEEVMGPQTGHPKDANPKHRHAIKLTHIAGDIDPLNGQAITHITWSEEDALPFPLCLSNLSSAPECRLLEDISIACGNVILVDHGRSVEQEFPKVPEGNVVECCKKEGLAQVSHIVPIDYNPVLNDAPLTFCEPLFTDLPASQMLIQNEREAIAKIGLESNSELDAKQEWFSQQDLFSSTANDYHFVAELDNDGRAHLRFGNNEMGRRPEACSNFKANYRIGNGVSGNVGAEVISHIYLANTTLDGVSLSVRNPMPAQGGVNAEPISDVKLFAPQAFRKELQRAIIADDYAAIVLREFKSRVQNTYARLRWTGSWYEVLVAIDPYDKELADQELLDEISACIHRYRRMGHDLVVRSAQRVPLDIELKICVLPNYLRGHVKAELLDLFSNKRSPNGNLGFFHPDKLSFGEDIYLSSLIATAQCVEGVESVVVCKFQRWCENPNNEIENGLLPLSPFEIARLDNDPSAVENGILTLDMRGGR
jgi:hypothetical protein